MSREPNQPYGPGAEPGKGAGEPTLRAAPPAGPPGGPPGPPPGAPERLRTYFDAAIDRAAGEAEPVNFDEIAAYVDGTLDEVDREIFEIRLEGDPMLRAEVEDLRELREAMGGVPAAIREPDTSREPNTSRAPDAKTGTSTNANTSTSGGESEPAAETETSRPAAPDVVPFRPPATRRTGGARQLWTLVPLAAAAAAVVGVTWLVVRSGSDVERIPPGVSTDAPLARDTGRQPEPGAPGATPTPGGTLGPSSAPPPQRRTPSGTAAPGEQLGPGSPTPATAPAAIVVRDSGRVLTVDPAAGHISGLSSAVSDTPPAIARVVVDALTAGNLPRVAALDGLSQRELTLMGPADRTPGGPGVTVLAPVAPAATVVRELRPTFRWAPHAGARGYTVTIYTQDFEPVLGSPAVQATAWTATQALTPGTIYQWQVTADTPDGPVRAPVPPAPDARFRILDTAARTALDRDLARARSSNLLTGLTLAQAGLLDDAEQAFTALLAENPDSPQIARLLARVRDRRPGANAR